MAHDCNCLFAPRVPAPRSAIEATAASLAGPSAVLDAEVAYWTNQGWQVVTTEPGEVVVQRSLPESLCANLLLTVATGLLWSAHWIYRARHPKIDTRRITVTGDSALDVELVTTRRTGYQPA